MNVEAAHPTAIFQTEDAPPTGDHQRPPGRHPMTQPPLPDEEAEPRTGGRTVVATLFGGAALIALILLWRVFGGGA